MRMPTKHPRWVRAMLLYMLTANVIPGLWAFVKPRAFYDSFPGFGRAWIAADGPYNEHLIRDVGAFFLAFTTLCWLALIRPRWVTVRAVAVCLLVFNVPHLLYHLNHLHGLPLIDQVGNVVALSVNVILPVGLLLYRPVPERSELLF